jgi:hypothetical protein
MIVPLSAMQQVAVSGLRKLGQSQVLNALAELASTMAGARREGAGSVRGTKGTLQEVVKIKLDRSH